MWKSGATGTLAVLLLLTLGGCGWLLPRPAEGFPQEILVGWVKEIEAPFYSEDIPEGSSGALGAVWREGNVRLWAEVIAFPDPDTAHARFVEETSTFSGAEGSDLGEEGVTLSHPPSGLALEFFRVGADLVLVGSLAASPEEAPPPERVRRVAEALVDRIPTVPPTSAGPVQVGGCTPPDESPYLKVIRVSLHLPDGGGNGAVTLSLGTTPTGDAVGGLCPYRFDLYLKCIELGEKDGDPGLRGPGDMFLAGSVSLPCGPLKFLTGEVAELGAGGSVEFPGDGLLIGSQDCLTTCGLSNFPVAVNLVLRNHNRVDLIDLLCGFFWALKRSAPEAGPIWETAESLSQDYGPEPAEPEDPEAAAEEIPGTTAGGGEEEVTVSLPGTYLEFQMTVSTPGECQRISEDTVRCRVPAGEEGQAFLTATLTPVAMVTISAITLPPWAVFQPEAGYGLVQSTCAFTPPLSAVGTTVELRFRASAEYYGLYRDLTLYLEVVAPEPG